MKDVIDRIRRYEVLYPLAAAEKESARETIREEVLDNWPGTAWVNDQVDQQLEGSSLRRELVELTRQLAVDCERHLPPKPPFYQAPSTPLHEDPVTPLVVAALLSKLEAAVTAPAVAVPGEAVYSRPPAAPEPNTDASGPPTGDGTSATVDDDDPKLGWQPPPEDEIPEKAWTYRRNHFWHHLKTKTKRKKAKVLDYWNSLDENVRREICPGSCDVVQTDDRGNDWRTVHKGILEVTKRQRNMTSQK